jgi:hypothetical protein
VAVQRPVSESQTEPETALTQLFLGPTQAEYDQGLRLIASGATGYSQLTITDNIANVYLTGTCASGGATYTIANLINANLKQFAGINYVKIYDQNGATQTPSGQSDSIPTCLEP